MVINENTIRKIVRESLYHLFENEYTEYRTKGALGKKTLAANAGKSAEEILAARADQKAEDDLASRWEMTIDDVNEKFAEDPEYDDTTAGGEYKIDKRNPTFFDKDGDEQSADSIDNFHNDFAIITLNKQQNYINLNGELLCDDWFDRCNDFESGFGMVSKGGKKNFVNGDGDYLLDTWVDRAGDFMGDFAPVIIDGQRYRVGKDGQIS